MRTFAAGISLAALAGFAACGGVEPPHPWIELPEGSGHQIIETGGLDDGQVVIAVDSTVTPDEALRLGEEILAQAPADATVNVRLYNDEATARNWSTVASEWTQQHLWVVVRASPGSGLREVRWVGPETEGVTATDSADVNTEPGADPAPVDSGTTL
ncbi:MAG: hypothetical protein WD737_14805 [Gemmatimonadota bacterium]